MGYTNHPQLEVYELLGAFLPGMIYSMTPPSHGHRDWLSAFTAVGGSHLRYAGTEFAGCPSCALIAVAMALYIFGISLLVKIVGVSLFILQLPSS